MTNRLHLLISNKKFTLYGEPISLYRKDNQNFLHYHGDEVPVDLDFKLPDKKEEKPPISIKYNMDTYEIEIEQAEYSDYKILNSQNNFIVRNGDSVSIDVLSSIDNLKIYLRSDNENQDILSITLKSDTLADKNYSEDNIKNTVYSMYQGDNPSLETVEKDDEYSLDLNLLLNLDKLDNVRMIDTGGYRRAFKVTGKIPNLDRNFVDKVVKVAIDMDGIESNKREFETWQAVKSISELRPYFCPITDRGPNYRYIVMEDASTDHITNEKVDDIHSVITEYIDSNSVNIPGSHNLDIRPNNIGEYNGKKVLIDYPFGGSLLKDDFN